MIQGKTIHLRTVLEEDLDSLYASFNDLSTRGEFFPLMLFSESSFRKEFRETGFLDEEKGRFLICDRDDRVLGGIWFFKTARYFDGYEIGYQMFDTKSRDKGVMTEALRLLTGWLFDTKKINRLQLGIMIRNKASKRVAEKGGFTFEGVARGAFFFKGANHDVEIWSILRGEYESQG